MDKNNIKKISQNPGVYIFKDPAGSILYIGKATNLKSRVSSYFSGKIENRPVQYAVSQISKIETIETDSVLEALILESNLIKKYQPKYNVDLKDDKSFSYAVITQEKFPRIIILRKTELEENKSIIKNSFGPYTSKKQLEIALKIIRKIFPYHSLKQNTEKGCLDYQIGLCPGPYAKNIFRLDYLKNIRNIKMILEGKKKSLVKKLDREMKEYSRKHEFEKAGEIRNKIFALNHIRDIALISKENSFNAPRSTLHDMRIEAYDISNISGQYAVGSMIVFKNSEPDKSQYRKFKIKTIQGADDVGMMREVLIRRFNNDWPLPNLILLDGGQGHLNMAQGILKSLGLNIPIAAVAKGPTRKNLELYYDANLQINTNQRIANILEDKKLIKQIMDKAHRFAISYHKKLRRKSFLQNLAMK
jgi:excinuclease ABC subunit C